MAEKTVYDLIKKQNGERFAKAIRNYDNGIFDIPGIVELVKYAGRQAEPIMNYLVSLKDIHVQESEGEIKDPFKLLYSAGYDAVYADTLEKQNAIKPYFAKNEELCTFRDPDRYKNYYIVNVVRKDVDSIKRKNFKNPQREDAYGTSVMSIQILKTGGFISIKNRYNHTVENPDNTYNSNPDNIVPGLADALRKYFNADFSSKEVVLPNGYARFGSHIVKYNAERDNVYYGADFFVKDAQIHEIDKRSQFILDDFVLDISNKSDKSADMDLHMRRVYGEDSALADVWRKEVAGKKLHITKTPAGATRIATDDGNWIDVRDGRVVGLAMPNVTDVPDDFLYNAAACETIELPQAKQIGYNFLYNNSMLQAIDLPSAEEIGANFLGYNEILNNVSLPNARTISFGFLGRNRALAGIELPRVREIGNDFLAYNHMLSHVDLPMVQKIGNRFLETNSALESISLPLVENIGDNFIGLNNKLRSAELPNVRVIGDDFLEEVRDIRSMDMPNVEKIGNRFMLWCRDMTHLSMPNVRKIGSSFLYNNTKLSRLVLPNVKEIGPGFLARNGQIKALRGVKPENRGRAFVAAMANRDKAASFNRGRALLQKMLRALGLDKENPLWRGDHNSMA